MKKKILLITALAGALAIGGVTAAHAAGVPTTCNSNGVSKSVHLTGKTHANGSAEVQMMFHNGASCKLPAIWK